METSYIVKKIEQNAASFIATFPWKILLGITNNNVKYQY